MSRLVLKYHATRGKEVINLLEMLGANRLGYKDTFVGFYYYIECEAIVSSDECPIDAKVFTLEEFEDKFPYKVGDTVACYVGLILGKEIHKIIEMEWDSDKCQILYHLDNCDVIDVRDILYVMERKTEQSKQENIKDNDNLTITNEEAEKYMIKIPEIPQSINLSQLNLNEIEVVLGDYEFVLKNGKTYFVKKKPQYPKTYKECCRVLGISDGEFMFTGLSDDEYDLFDSFVVIKRCRDAYWKIAGEDLGLGKPWEPDWKNFKVNKFCIGVDRNITSSCNKVTGNKILAFPTAEMRDAFYENFKYLIEKCKELL